MSVEGEALNVSISGQVGRIMIIAVGHKREENRVQVYSVAVAYMNTFNTTRIDENTGIFRGQKGSLNILRSAEKVTVVPLVSDLNTTSKILRPLSCILFLF